jgi:hypothetical protein
MPPIAKDPAKVAQWKKEEQERTTEMAKAFQFGNPSAQVGRVAGASHFIFRSNQAEVRAR